MRIKKIATSIGVVGRVLGEKSDSTKDTYSCDYINNNSLNIIDVTQSQNGRYITSKIPFNTEGILFFIFQPVSSWSNHTLQIAIFNGTSENISVIGNWEQNDNAFLVNSIFEIANTNQIRVKKYAQGNDITLNNFANATDSSYGAIRPNKIYAVTMKKNL